MLGGKTAEHVKTPFTRTNEALSAGFLRLWSGALFVLRIRIPQ